MNRRNLGALTTVLPVATSLAAPIPAIAQEDAPLHGSESNGPVDTDALAQEVQAYNDYLADQLLSKEAAPRVSASASDGRNRSKAPRLAPSARPILDEKSVVNERVRSAMAEKGTEVHDTRTSATLQEATVNPATGNVEATFERHVVNTLEDGQLWEEWTTQIVEFDPSTNEIVSSVDLEAPDYASAGDVEVPHPAPDGERGRESDQDVASPEAEEPMVSIQGHIIMKDRPAAVQYALDWAKSRHPAYGNWSNDCTNFVSQVMKAGGWPGLKGPGGQSDPNSWYSDGYATSQVSLTWIRAENFFSSARNNYHRMKRVPDNNGFATVLADVIAADWDNDGRKDHLMVVTGKTDGGDRLLSYHSTDTRNRPLSAIKASYPNAWYYSSHT